MELARLVSLCRFAVAALFAASLAGACAKPPEKHAQLNAAQAADPAMQTANIRPSDVAGADTPPLDVRVAQVLDNPGSRQIFAVSGQPVDTRIITASTSGRTFKTGLAGRIVKVGRISDLVLEPGEVVLTFDDGPSPTYTPRILATLDTYGVKATFFMVGRMAASHPLIAQMVAEAGHTIGSHTEGHENLAHGSLSTAVSSVSTGEESIASAIAPVHKKLAPFFRFPYLSETRVLQAKLTDMGLVVFGTDVDSLDFKHDSPATVLTRTLSRLDAKGGGIVLFHDIHQRTAKLLPDFLQALLKRGYKVVQVVPKTKSFIDLQTLVASSDLRLGKNIPGL